MSWHHYFPLIDDQFVEAFRQESEQTAPEREALEVAQVFPPAPSPRLTLRYTPSLRPKQTVANHLLSYALPSWQPNDRSDPSGNLPEPSLITLQETDEGAGELCTSYWGQFVSPLLRNVPFLLRDFPGVSVRLYLPQNLSCLVELLAGLGCEVHLMKMSTCGSLCGSFWKFLACDDENTAVTLFDPNDIWTAGNFLSNAPSALQTGLAFWRRPMQRDEQYWPLDANAFGVLGGQENIKELLAAYLWNLNQNDGSELLNRQIQDCPFTQLANPNLKDEQFFASCILYPRFARLGTLTLLPLSLRSPLIGPDIEYVTWNNENSEVILTGL